MRQGFLDPLKDVQARQTAQHCLYDSGRGARRESMAQEIWSAEIDEEDGDLREAYLVWYEKVANKEKAKYDKDRNNPIRSGGGEIELANQSSSSPNSRGILAIAITMDQGNVGGGQS